ncbi:MAG: PBP1A family penicillin-binding protein [Bauldia sp.]|nr:PBP1A family penicillin-binding protein [Bauldia sp.]
MRPPRSVIAQTLPHSLHGPTLGDRQTYFRFGAATLRRPATRRPSGPGTTDRVFAAVGRVLGRVPTGVSAFYHGLDRTLSHLRVRGFGRFVVEVTGDGLTIATFGAVVMLALALPAMEATETDWRSQGDYAVTFLDQNGVEIGRRGIRQLESVPIAEMPDYLVASVLSTEDRRFYTHFGVDLFGTARALIENFRAGTIVQGGSSITQQVARLLFLSNDRTVERKVQEAFIAVWLDATLSKDEILKLYLDRGYLGAGNFGVAAASQYYFDKPVQDLTLAEAAMLAGLFQAPTRYAPHVNLPAARARANEVLTNLVQAGYLTEGQVIGARRRPASVVAGERAPTPDYFLDWAFEEVKALVPTGDRILTVRTTLDTSLQRAAEDALESTLRQSGEAYSVRQGAAVIVEPDGAVRAMVGGRDYGESQFNRAVSARRQPGSAFKPFVYATAMMNGYTPDSVVPDAPITIGDWSPRNYSGGYAGPVTLTTALVQSINTVPVRLGQAIGRELIAETAQRMGIRSSIAITRSLPLGSSEVSVIDMASAFAVFANGGMAAPAFGIATIVNSQGITVFQHGDTPPPERVLPEEVVAQMNGMMVQVPEWGTGRAAKLEGIPTAGKTGTTSSFRDAWFVGFTGDYVGAIWFGNDNYAETVNLTGGTLPAQTWQRVMTAAHQGIELTPIPFVERAEYDAARVARAAAANAAIAAAAPVEIPPPPLAPAAQQRLEALGQLLAGNPP